MVRRRDAILRASIAGARAWVVYGVVETIFLSLLPWIAQPSFLYRPVDPGVTAIAIGLYAAIGALLGALGCWCWRLLKRNPSDPDATGGPEEALATLTMVVAAVLSGVSEVGDHRTVLPPLLHLVFSALLAGAIVSVLAAGDSTRRLQLIVNPWVASALLIAPASIAVLIPSPGRGGSQHFVSIRIAVGLVVVLGVLVAGSWIYSQKWRAARPLIPPFPSGAASWRAPVFLAVGVTIISAFLPGTAIRNEVTRSTPRPGLPNVILISLDTVRADHLSVYGYQRNTSPRLEALARQATLFTRAISTSDYTLPSHASMLTSVYASEHGAYFRGRDNIDRPLGARWHTLPEILLDHGYETVGVSANYGFVSRDFGMDQGFAVFDQRQPGLLLAEVPSYYLRHSLNAALASMTRRYYLQRMYRTAEEVNRDVVALLDRRPRDGAPIFLFINYMDAHAPYLPPPPFDRLFIDRPDRSPALINKMVRRPLDEGHGGVFTADEKAVMVSQYDGAIAYLDRHLGRLFDTLRAGGQFDNALVIVTSDHGEAFGERNVIGHGASVHQDQIHVPLIVKYPGDVNAQVVEDVVSGVDLLPTVLDVVGADREPAARGESLRRLAGRAREVYAEHFARNDAEVARPPVRDEPETVDRAVTRGPLKLISWAGGRRALFNLSTDPDETTDLYRLDDPVARRLESFLTAWVQSTADQRTRQPEPAMDQRDRLRSLGYIR